MTRSSTPTSASSSPATVNRQRRSSSDDDLAALEETLEILSDPETMADLRAAQVEIAAGTAVGLTEFPRR